ncbi:Mitochondrial beta-keto-acyl synthase [Kalmusia sp. IMI 367209]|nr:Mitochondrial beta-keto-acyl synthase [Kalmusia sp. IMI 367209]
MAEVEELEDSPLLYSSLCPCILTQRDVEFKFRKLDPEPESEPTHLDSSLKKQISFNDDYEDPNVEDASSEDLNYGFESCTDTETESLFRLDIRNIEELRKPLPRSSSVHHDFNTATGATTVPTVNFEASGPRRKRSAFVQERELRCLIEDRLGTPHLSELQPGDDVNAQLNVEELSVGGEFAALSIAGEVPPVPSLFAITEILDEGLRLN